MKIGFIGLGAMGAPMVFRLLDAGHDVVVCDVNAAALQVAKSKGAIAAASPAEVASLVETVLVSLPTPDVVRDVAFGEKGLIHGAVMKHYVDLSTTGAKTAIEVANRLSQNKVICLDAPVSGGIAAAAAGTLAVMVSGDHESFSRLETILKTLGSRTSYVGSQVGQGQTLKLINNLLVATTLAASSEALVLGTKAGLDLSTMLEVINASSGRSFATEKIIPGTFPERTFDFGFRTELMYKDVRLCLEEAENLRVPMLLGNSVKQLWSYAMSQGAGGNDFSAIVKVFEDWSKVQVGVSTSKVV